MSLVTGSPVGNLDLQTDLFWEGAPSLYFQDSTANPLNNPDASGFYWNLSGTSTYPVYEIGCPLNVSLTEGLTTNDILCDNVGMKNSIQQRNYVDFVFEIKTLFPLQTLKHILKTSAVTEVSPTQKMGIGQIDNNIYYHVYAPKVYDDAAGDYLWIYLHKCRFVDAWTINMPLGDAWRVSGLKLRAFVDTTKPSTQYFGMFGVSDLSLIP